MECCLELKREEELGPRAFERVALSAGAVERTKRDATGRRQSGGRGEAGTQASAAAGGGRWCSCWWWRRRREEEEEANTREQSVPTIPDSSSINFATPTAAPLTRCPSP